MPKRIFIIGLLFFTSGLLAIWDVLSSLSTHHIRIDFGVLTLPIGLGLLSGKSSSRTWAKCLIILGYAICLALSLATLIMRDGIKLHLLGRRILGSEGVPYALAGICLLTAILFLLHRLLYSPKADAFFQKHDTGSRTGS